MVRLKDPGLLGANLTGHPLLLRLKLPRQLRQCTRNNSSNKDQRRQFNNDLQALIGPPPQTLRLQQLQQCQESLPRLNSLRINVPLQIMRLRRESLLVVVTVRDLRLILILKSLDMELLLLNLKLQRSQPTTQLPMQVMHNNPNPNNSSLKFNSNSNSHHSNRQLKPSIAPRRISNK